MSIPVPSGMLPGAVEVWDEVVAWLEERDVWSVELVPAVERYARAVDLARRSWKRAGKTLTTRGSMGQQVAHPALAVAQKADAEAAKFGAMLGIDLSAKRAPGRPAGSASAKDRVMGPTEPQRFTPRVVAG